MFNNLFEFKKKYIFYSYSSILMALSFLGLMEGWSFFMSDYVLFLEWELFYSSSVSIVFTLLFDWMSLIFLSVVSFISSMVMIYSHSYMGTDSNFYRFVSLVFLFVASMIFMILSPNMISILLGWDGLGLVSYALVIYYQNSKSSSAGMLTVLSNRIGDVGILVSITWMFNYGSWDFFYLQHLFKSYDLILLMMIIAMAGMTKSAQLPFSAWLPAAMAAPTPVSALVHSSTLVTAGVYLLIRFNELLGVNFGLTIISVTTLFMAGLSANYEFDLKKIIALSTLSQLGMMMVVLSLGNSELAFFHLISHALFKSLLFLCAGFYIHSNLDSQDIRLLGSVSGSFPLTNLLFVGCSLSLCGFPFLAGFYSKDLILESYFFEEMNWLIYFLLFMGTMFTFSYSIRLIYYLYYGEMKLVSVMSGEHDLNMLVPMMGLFIASVMAGSVFIWLFFPPLMTILPMLVKWSILTIGLMLGLLVFKGKSSKPQIFVFPKNLKMFFFKLFIGNMWGLPYLSTAPLGKLLGSGSVYMSSMDYGWLEYMGGQGLINWFMVISSIPDKLNVLGFKSYIFMTFLIFLSVALLI
uniref:NADH-ubiquinone oxidoreductase chain 5 n=1 Tax=Brachystomella parvula TaxID=187611 RepID=A0A650BJX0_9HEXA|nr:NADH dehydrogenase subunit 5 [Brachystomella parvula]